MAISLKQKAHYEAKFSVFYENERDALCAYMEQKRQRVLEETFGNIIGCECMQSHGSIEQINTLARELITSESLHTLCTDVRNNEYLASVWGLFCELLSEHVKWVNPCESHRHAAKHAQQHLVRCTVFRAGIREIQERYANTRKYISGLLDAGDFVEAERTMDDFIARMNQSVHSLFSEFLSPTPLAV